VLAAPRKSRRQPHSIVWFILVVDRTRSCYMLELSAVDNLQRFTTLKKVKLAHT